MMKTFDVLNVHCPLFYFNSITCQFALKSCQLKMLVTRLSLYSVPPYTENAQILANISFSDLRCPFNICDLKYNAFSLGIFSSYDVLRIFSSFMFVSSLRLVLLRFKLCLFLVMEL